MTAHSKHIAIVGAGLVGSLLAIYLRKRGYKVSLFERRADMRKNMLQAGRSINLALSNRGIRALEEVGLADAIRPVAIPMHGRMMHDVKGNLTFQAYGKEGQYINSVSRSNLNIVLMNKAEAEGATLHFNQRVTQIDTDKTTIAVTSPENHLEIHTFDLIIGADGAFSAIRQSLQATDRFDFSQAYIAHGYKELHIPAGTAGAFQLEKNALHIWPRQSYMMIALPNPDGSFTCTLFFPFDGETSFTALSSDHAIKDFFNANFPDAAKLMPSLLRDFYQNPTSSLVTMKCFPWVKNKTLLIGDAAHAIVPFYGQGMNAGFEDCRILNILLGKYHDQWETVLPEFQNLRKPDTDAIAQLALDNFIEMRDLVGDADFLLRKKIEAKLHSAYPDRWIPLYSMVTFNDNIRYSEAYSISRSQKKIMDEVMSRPGIETTWESLDLASIIQRLPNG
ncbi:MAG TPA: NAD(P)/FAD-dependent oxidoreductase [Ohtaekwangia sp.]|uniref:FAD-dependent oxidoreductase n=1 Tax=Ohtaekwangia sp. TaxID=2066019 RepID=UPI002F93D277